MSDLREAPNDGGRFQGSDLPPPRESGQATHYVAISVGGEPRDDAINVYAVHLPFTIGSNIAEDVRVALDAACVRLLANIAKDFTP